MSRIPLDHNKTTLINAKVEASLPADKLYNVVPAVHENKVKYSHCPCSAGAGYICKDVSALQWHMLDIQRMGHLFTPKTMSRKSKPRTWGTS